MAEPGLWVTCPNCGHGPAYCNACAHMNLPWQYPGLRRLPFDEMVERVESKVGVSAGDDFYVDISIIRMVLRAALNEGEG